MIKAFILLVAAIAAHALLAPYTKVEESFNTQATHDLLFHGTNIDAYDHLEFPGVVPRTFLGPLSIASVLYPIRLLLEASGRWSLVDQKYAMLLGTRLALGSGLALSLLAVAQSLRSPSYPRHSATFFLLACATQFHLPFWGSRPLPNTFALILVTYAIAFFLRPGSQRAQMPDATTALFALAGIVFRSELVLLAVPLYLLEAARGTVHLTRARFWVPAALFASLSLAATVTVDSYFWQRESFWPELNVLLFNTVANQSHRWGVAPWHAYLTLHVPKMLLGAGPWAVLGAASAATAPRLRVLTTAASLFVIAYSLLPHKEARFVIYAVPIANAAAGVAMARVWTWSSSGTGWKPLRRVVRVAVLGSLAASAAVSVAMSAASAHNYPGGDALRCVQRADPRCTSIVDPTQGPVALHIDVVTAQTGASRFLERTDRVHYDKSEGLSFAARASPRRFHARFTSFDDWVRDAGLAEAEAHALAGKAVCFDGFAGVDLRRAISAWVGPIQVDGTAATNMTDKYPARD
ncbi:Alg9-like mannosyltransferase family-domain-containing protein [Blastocladiella britannica]|nr:Alg9-like mannosyltransferase family-domain-containing protein [Blastocladiella britannica]